MKGLYKPRVYCRLLADGKVIGPTHTRAYLHHLVKVHKENEERKRNYVGGWRHD